MPGAKKGVEVELQMSELLMAIEVGTLRQIEAIRRGMQDRHGYDGAGWDNHIEGSAGEMALAKHLGIYWGGKTNVFKDPDLGNDIQVRTRLKGHYELIVRDGDADEEIFVLLVGKHTNFRIVGWMRGADCKRAEWLRTHGNRPPAYFVPQDALNPIETLPLRR